MWSWGNPLIFWTGKVPGFQLVSSELDGRKDYWSTTVSSVAKDEMACHRPRWLSLQSYSWHHWMTGTPQSRHTLQAHQTCQSTACTAWLVTCSIDSQLIDATFIINVHLPSAWNSLPDRHVSILANFHNCYSCMLYLSTILCVCMHMCNFYFLSVLGVVFLYSFSFSTLILLVGSFDL